MIKANIIYTFDKYDQETITLDLNLEDLGRINEVKFISYLIQNSFNDYEKYLVDDLKKMSIHLKIKDEKIFKKFSYLNKVIKRWGKYFFNQKNCDVVENKILLHAQAIKFF
jgi:hypothetical protein|tara:strand:- start:94 stop:426 length:333 start_codon:yes stop_codon:yes gene_type:complete